MKINIEPIIIGLRALEDDQNYGDPYIWCATGIKAEDDVLKIILCQEIPTPKIWRALKRDLKAAGWKKVIYTHYKNGETKNRVINL